MIREYLQKLGLSEKETTLYLAVLQKGRVGVHQVALITGINRTTVYSLANELADKGFIIVDLGSKPNVLMAVPPEQLRTIAEKQKNIIDSLIPELHSISQNTGFSVPKIRFVPEVDLESYLYSEVERWDKSLVEVDSIVWGMQDPTFAPKYQEWIKWYYSRSETQKYKVNIISNSREENLENFSERKILELGGDLDFNSAIWVWGHYIIMVSYKEKPNYLIEIYDKKLAHNLRELFRGIWLQNK